MGGTTGNDPVASFAPAIAGPQHWRISRSHFRAGDRHQEGINAPLLEARRRGHWARRLNSICSCRGLHQSCGMREGALSRSSSSLATDSDEP